MIENINDILRPDFGDGNDRIDEDLKREGLFCVWKGVGKIPHNPITQEKACVNDPSTFTSFEIAKTEYLADGEWDGIGMLNQNGYGFIDIDNCVENGKISKYAWDIITLIHGYTEFSPSATGVRIVFWIDIKKQTCANRRSWTEGKEIYREKYYQKNSSAPNITEAYFPEYTNRYATITGKVIPGCEGWKSKDVDFANLRIFLNTYMKKPASEKSNPGHARDVKKMPLPVDDISDTELLDKIRQSQESKFLFLYNTPIDPDSTGESENDQALADILCWWTCHDRDRIERLMFMSQRVRNKWYKRPDYINKTIEKALRRIPDDQGFAYKGVTNQEAVFEPLIEGAYNVAPEGVSIDIVEEEKPAKPVPIDYSKYTASNIEIKMPEFLFYPYVPRGYFTILSASPGVGKTYFSCWLSAMVSKGIPLNERSIVKNGKVLYCSLEDGAPDTLVPRFKACGGVDENFIVLDQSADINPSSFSDPMIKRFITDLNPDLIVFDAVTSYIGNANMNHANEVRNALKPLIKIIQGTGTAVLLIAHNNKMSSDGSAQNRISGTVDFSAVVRSGINVGRNPKNRDNLAVGHFKSNFTELGPTLEFEYRESEYEDIPGIFLIGTLEDVSANSLVNSGKSESAASEGRSINKMEQAKNMIYETFARYGGFIPRNVVISEVQKAINASERTIIRAFESIVDSGSGYHREFDRSENGKIKAVYWCDPLTNLPDNPEEAWRNQANMDNVIIYRA